MFHPDALRPIPRAHLDPIRTQYDALLLIMMTMDCAVRFETIVLTLDAERCGHGMLKVTGTDDADAVLGVVDMVAECAERDPEVAGIVVASVRPDGGPEYRDLDRWEEVNGYCEDCGIELVEWFVLGSSISSPRELCGVRARWVS